MQLTKLFTAILILALAFSSCKTCRNAGDNDNNCTKGATIGTVSHQYREGGCATVIIVSQPEGDSMVLIPKDPLPEKLDKDGLVILFDYRVLKMPNPEGCNVGIPAEIINISKQ